MTVDSTHDADIMCSCLTRRDASEPHSHVVLSVHADTEREAERHRKGVREMHTQEEMHTERE